jgi:hypothetical protein
MRRSARDFLPLKDLVFRILVALGDGERHGWALGQSINELAEPAEPASRAGQSRILPGQLYRTLDAMLADGLIAERSTAMDPPAKRAAGGAAPSRFFYLTPFGRAVATAETDRLASLVALSRGARLLKQPTR